MVKRDHLRCRLRRWAGSSKDTDENLTAMVADRPMWFPVRCNINR
jgi:hypothetical protein